MNSKNAKKIRKFMKNTMLMDPKEYRAVYQKLKREMKQKGVA